MKRNKSELKLLLDTVDDWFSDKAYRIPVNLCTENTLEADHAKLAQISRTTSEWFSSLTDAITNEGIEDDSQPEDTIRTCSHETHDPPEDQVIEKPKVVKQRNTRKCKPRLKVAARKLSSDKEENFDELAKDLERILEQEDETLTPAEPLIEYFNFYSDDELALLDSTIGAYCTLVNRNNSFKAKSERVNESSKWSSLTDNSKLVENKFTPTNTRKNLRKFSNPFSLLPLKPDLEYPKTQTPCIMTDHDYLGKVPVKPLVLNNKLIQCAKHTQIPSPVLNVAALRKFARFSDQFRRASIEHDRVLAICNE